MSSSGRKAEIIERFIEHCQRAPQMSLGFLEVDEDVYACPSETAEIVTALTGEFSLDVLVGSGVLVHGEQEAVALAPALASGTSFIVMRDAVNNQPFELLTRDGCLSADALPAFQILRDSHTRKLIEEGPGELVVAFDLDHVVMLRACGLPATLATGLDDLPLEQVDQFCELFGLTRCKSDRATFREEATKENGGQSECHPDDPIRRVVGNVVNDGVVHAGEKTACSADGTSDVSAEPIDVHLVFLGWAPLELSDAVPLRLKATVDFLHQLQRFMGVDLHDIGLWEAKNETIERLRFIAERKSSLVFQEVLLEAAENISGSIMHFGKEKPQAIMPPNDYPTALTRLSAIADGGTRLPGPNSRNEAWRNVRRLLEQQIVGPVRETALVTGDPVVRSLWMVFANLSEVFHLISVETGEQLSRCIAARGVEHGDQIPEEQFNKLMAVTDRLINTARTIEKCSRRTTIIESKIIDSPSFPRLPHCG